MLLLIIDCKPSSLFSIKLPKSYQSQPSFLLPPPSTLFGIYARGIGVALGLPQLEAQELAAKTLVNTSASSLGLSTRSGALVRRWRIEEETPISDAMVREFIYTTTLRLYFIVEEGEFKLRDLDKILYLCGYSCSRIGDSESIVSISSVKVAKVYREGKVREGRIAGYVPEDVVKEVSKGEYIAVDMPTMLDARKYKTYILPLSVREKYYVQSDVYVKFRDGVSCIKVDGGYLNV
jgi:CRISPR-associated protein Cas5 subtype I-A